MDKEFWASIMQNDYKIPSGYTGKELTEVLFSYLPSTDPELRDDIAYTVYANWLEQEVYTREEVNTHVHELLANLEKGIGETESDSVFLRAFAVLFLAEIVHNDNQKLLLEKEQVQLILDRGLAYLNAERDPRGYVPVKGWAHALAHTADLLLVLGRNRYLGEGDLLKILNAISTKMIHATNYLYVHREDERLARAVMDILKRSLIPLEKVEFWAKSFLAPGGKEWKGAFADGGRNRAFQNTRNLLRSVCLELTTGQEPMPENERLQKAFFDALKNLKYS